VLLQTCTTTEFSDLSSDKLPMKIIWSTSNWEEFLNTGELFSFDISAYQMFSISYQGFDLSNTTVTQDDMYPLFSAISTPQPCIINHNRTIAAPVNTDGILNLEGSSGLPLATISLANANSSLPTTLPSR
jgi:hypothetical protein